MSKTAQLLVAGVIGIGMVTALTLPGRQTIGVANSLFQGTSGLLNTSIKG